MVLGTACAVVDPEDASSSAGETEPVTPTAGPETGESGETGETGETEPPLPDMGTSPDTDGEPEPQPPGCECIDVGDEDSGPIVPMCNMGVCPEIEASDVDFEGPVIANSEALDCALAALRDRTPGVVRWTSTTGGGQFTEDGYVLINDDGVSAVRRDWGWHDLYYTTDAARLMNLLAPSAYDECLADPDDAVRFECVRQTLDTVVICDPGWDSDEF